MINKERGNIVTKNGSTFSQDTCGLDQQFGYQLATSLKRPCYVAAEVDGSLLSSTGITFTIGDNSIIGTYQNVPLALNSLYSVTIAVVVILMVSVQRTIFVLS